MSIRPYISILGGKPFLYFLIVSSLSLFLIIFLRIGLVPAMVLSIAPLAGYMLIRMIERPLLSFLGLFVVNYFIMGLTRYIPGIPAGIVMDAFLLLTLMFVLFRTRDRAVGWSDARNLLSLFSGIWLVYCILLVFNTETSLANWAAGVRGLALYLFLFPLFTSLLLNQYKYLKLFLFIWSLLTLLAVIKALVQKFIGFDAAELYWLNVAGGRSTHIIFSGIRYFSFFTDAASFGCNMGMSLVVFSVTAFYIRPKSLQLYYIAIALLAGYGMMISGTRAAMAVPFVGFAFYVFLSKQLKIIIPGIILIIMVFVFFKFTYIGHGNTEIRRMRSAFNVTQDASFKLRKSNQEKMQVFMQEHPFGIGIGKAKRTEPGDYMYQLPTDSSLIYIWVETGIVGILLFSLILLVTFVKGSYDILFKIRNRQLRGLNCALLAGTAGLLISAYANEVLQQFPNGPIVYMCVAFIFMGRKFDKAISDEEST